MVQVKFKNGYIGTLKEKVAELLIKKGEAEPVKAKQPELIKEPAPKKHEKSGGEK